MNITTHQNVKMELEDKSKNNSTKNIVKLNYVTNEVATEVKLLPSVEELLKIIVAKAGFISHEISRSMILNKGSSHSGDLYEIDIKGETKDGPKEINAFLKQAFAVGTMNSLCDVKTSYSKEVLFYTELSHIFNELQNSVPDKERLKIVKSYGCISDAIILENLCRKGFESLNFLDVMPLNFAELAIAQLAKLNGLAYVLNYKRKDYFDKNIKTLESTVRFDEINIWKNYAKKIIEISTAHFTKDTQAKIDYFLQNSFYVKFPKFSTGDTDLVKFLCHGDFRISNMMMRRSDKEEPQVILIDYQTLIYGSPIMDLLFFVYTGTDRKFRKAHLNYLKDLYHNKLNEFLKYFDIDINDVYPKNVYEKDFKDSLDFGLMVALYVCPILFIIQDLSKDTVNDKSFKMDDRLKERINEVVEEFIEWGILK